MNTHVPLRSILLASNLADIDWLFPFTCSLAEESGARITVLHVISPLNGFAIDLAGLPYYRPDEAVEGARKLLRGACCRPCSAGLQTEVMSIDGPAADGILTAANRVQADLIVVGTRAYRGLDKWLHGSVAEQVLRSSPVPVAVIGPHARHAAAMGHPIKSILFATSLQAQLTDAVNVNIALRWMERLHAHMTLLHVADSQKDPLAQERSCQAREQELRRMLPEEAFRTNLVDAHVRTGRPSREILAAAAGVNLIILGAVRQPMLGRLAPEGTLHQVLAEAHCPVVTLHSEHPPTPPASIKLRSSNPAVPASP